VYKGVGDIVIYESGVGAFETIAVTSAQVTIVGPAVTIDPANALAYDTGYHVLIDDGAIAGYGGISDPAVWNFATEAAPAIFSLAPEDNSSDAAIDADLVVTFDKTVTMGTGSIHIYESGGALLESIDVASATFNGAEVTVNPLGFMDYATDYYVQIDDGAIVGFSGIADTTTWNFSTAEETPNPAIVYESFTYATGDLNGKTADAGLAAWSAGAIYDVASPGLTYNDGTDDLPVQGYKMLQAWGKNEDATASITIPGGWSSASHDGGNLNKAGAVIWVSMILNPGAKDGFSYNYFRFDGVSGYFGVEGTAGSWRLQAQNGDATDSASSASFIGNTEYFLMMKLATDASNNSTLSAWLNPPLDGGEAALGVADASITVNAQADGSATQFNRIHMHQGGNVGYPQYDEIRMAETFYHAVGRYPYGVMFMFK